MVQWENGKHWLFAAALVAAVFLAYQPAWQGGFIWDDDLHLLNNPVLKPGGLITTWIPGSYVNYWPITALAYRLQFELWGLKPVGFHMVNIARTPCRPSWYGESSRTCGYRGPCSRLPLFALHPVNVESVAWITQLKNILSLLLTLDGRALLPASRAVRRPVAVWLSLGAFLSGNAFQGHDVDPAGGVAGVRLVAARPHLTRETCSRRPFLSDRTGDGRYGSVHATVCSLHQTASSCATTVS